MRTWMLMVYKVPNEPSAPRVYVWRKLKKLGAVLLHDAVWVLPATARTREQLRWLASEIEEMNGEASVWESRPSLTSQDDGLVVRFTEAVEATYQKVLLALDKKDADLEALARSFRQASAVDYFGSSMQERVRSALEQAREGEAS